MDGEGGLPGFLGPFLAGRMKNIVCHLPAGQSEDSVLLRTDTLRVPPKGASQAEKK